MTGKKKDLPEKARVNIDQGVTLGGVLYRNEKNIDLTKHAPEQAEGEEDDAFTKRQEAYQDEIAELFEKGHLITPEQREESKEADREAKAAAREDAAEARSKGKGK